MKEQEHRISLINFGESADAAQRLALFRNDRNDVDELLGKPADERFSWKRAIFTMVAGGALGAVGMHYLPSLSSQGKPNICKSSDVIVCDERGENPRFKVPGYGLRGPF